MAMAAAATTATTATTTAAAAANSHAHEYVAGGAKISRAVVVVDSGEHVA